MKKILKKYKELIIALIIILLVVGVVIIQNKETTGSSRENITENQETSKKIIEMSAENILKKEKEFSMSKGSNFVKIGNLIACCNYDNNIYLIDLEKQTQKLLCNLEEGINKLYFDGEYVYSIPYYYRGKGIYKIDLEGNFSKIYDKASLQLLITENEIYFVEQTAWDDMNQNVQGNLYKMEKNGENKKLLIEGVRNSFVINNGYIYYTDQNTKGIYRTNLEGGEKTKLAEGRTAISTVTDNVITFVDFKDSKNKIIYLDTGEVKQLGNFGNSFKIESDTYVYTRTSIDENFNENCVLYKIDTKTHKEIELWKNDLSLDYLEYVYKKYAYFRFGNEFGRVNLETGEKEIIGGVYNCIIGDKAYKIKTNENQIVNCIDIYDFEKDQVNTIEIQELY